MIIVILTFAALAVSIYFAWNRLSIAGGIAGVVCVIGFVVMSFCIIEIPAQFGAYQSEREAVQKRLFNAENNTKLAKSTKTITLRLVRENNAFLEDLKSYNQSAWLGLFTPDTVDAIYPLDPTVLERKETK